MASVFLFSFWFPFKPTKMMHPPRPTPRPDRISNVAKLESAILKGNDLPFMLQKQAARERTKTSHKAGGSGRVGVGFLA